MLFSLLFTIVASNAQNIPSQKSISNSSPASYKFSNARLSYKIISTSSQTFGYDIYSGDHKMIHQPSVPALPGNEGFKTKTAAVKVAQLVIQKIQTGEMPPTVTIKELKKMGAIK